MKCSTPNAPTAWSWLTPVTATAAVGSAVLAAGYPAMLEKPPGRNRAEITALIRASQQGNAPAMVAFNRRCSPLLTRGMELLKQEAPKEKLEHIRCDFYRSERFDADFSTTAVHGIDAVRHLSGSRYARVDFHYQELERDAGQICNFFLTGTMTGGCSVQLSFCPSTGAALERFTLNTRSLTVSVESVPPGGGCDFPGRIFVYRGGKLLRIEAPPAHEFDREEFYLAGYYQENCRFIERLREASRRKTISNSPSKPSKSPMPAAGAFRSGRRKQSEADRTGPQHPAQRSRWRPPPWSLARPAGYRRRPPPVPRRRKAPPAPPSR